MMFVILDKAPYSTADNPGIEKWRFYTDGWVEDSPIIDSDGTIYFGGNYGGLPWYLFAVNPDGTEKWKYKTGGLIWGSSPAMAEDGTIYVGSWDTKLYAINPDGTQKWATGSGGSIASSPAIADDGTIYFGTMSSGNSIIAMNPNGTIKWKYQTGYSIVSDPAIADDGTIYIGSGDTYFYAINPNGTLKWRFKTGDIIKAHPSIAEDGTIYIASFDHNLYALNSDGSLKWSRSSGYSGSSSVAIGEDGTLYFGGDKLYAAYPNNGTTKWSFDLGNRVTGKSSPAVSADGTIYVGLEFSYGDGGEIIAINHHGTEKWCKRIAGHWVESSPCIAEDGTIYIGSSDTISSGYLHAFSPQESNTPPGTPIITGPTTGNAGVEYKYTFFSVDPDNNPVSFYLEWDDGTNPSWSKEYASGETAKIKHTWNNQGSYTISVKARDTFDGESGWAYFDITMPRNKIISKDFFIQFLQNHPNLFQLVRFLLKM
jgi:outer membrane protein assembly factor BamB